MIKDIEDDLLAGWLVGVKRSVNMSRQQELESRVAGYLQSADQDSEGNVTVRHPTGMRVYVPPSQQSCVNLPPRDQTLPDDYAGRYTPILRGRIVFGPQPKRFFATSCIFLFILVLLSIQAKEVERDCGTWVLLLGFTVHLLSFLAFLIICLSDPGVIPDNYRLRELISETRGYRERSPEARFYRYCSTCRGFRPPRSKHCENCDICIRDHETHLFVGGTCVGQKTARSLFMLSIGVGLLTLYIIIVNSIILHKASPELRPWQVGVSITCLVMGVLLVFTPQLGILLFIFRFYLIGSGYTGSSFIHRKTEWMACPLDKRTAVQHYTNFFFGKKQPSVFRRDSRRVAPATGSERQDEAVLWNADLEALLSLPEEAFPHLQELLLRSEDNDARWVQLRRNQLASLFNNNLTSEEDAAEEENMKGLVANARAKIIPSDPQLQDGDLDPVHGQRVKKGLKSRLRDILHQKIEDFHKPSRKSPKSGITMKQSLSPTTLSEGAIPHTAPETQNLVTTARAQQFRRLIQLILTRDREGLLEMGRTVNIPALLGVEHFDPDNYQFIELSNGLPMLAQRRRDAAQAANMNRFTGLLGIPQMVAAGLLPPARQLAQDVENAIGPGSIRRVANPTSSHVTYQTQRVHNRTAAEWGCGRHRNNASGRHITFDHMMNRGSPILDTQFTVQAPQQHRRERERIERIDISTHMPMPPLPPPCFSPNRRTMRERDLSTASQDQDRNNANE